MMNTREELLSGLNDAVSIIRQLSNIQTRLNQVRGQYKSIIQNKKMGKLAKLILIFLILNCVYNLVRFNIWGIIIGAIEFGLAYVIINFVYKKMNEKIDADNQRIIAENENVKAQEQAVLNELQNVQIAYRERISSWYPDNYCSVEAVEFFYNAVMNYRADNLKEAINLYETFLHQRRVEANQKKAVEQQKLNNLLSAGSLMMQGLALGEQSRHNATAEFEMQRANRALNDIQTRL